MKQKKKEENKLEKLFKAIKKQKDPVTIAKANLMVSIGIRVHNMDLNQTHKYYDKIIEYMEKLQNEEKNKLQSHDNKHKAR